MNKIFKLKLNRTRHELEVVSELATSAVASTTVVTPAESQAASEFALEMQDHQVNSLTRACFLVGTGALLALAGAQPSWALDGMSVVSGAATMVQNGSVITIHNSPNAILNWNSFNIGKGEIVEFIQQTSNSAVLNRVLGNNASEILGTLKSNGQVFLINPNGILFGKSAVVDTNGLVASTLNLSNEDFLAGKYVFNQDKDAKIASVLNQGLIKISNDGSLALIGGNVVNSGILEAKNGTVYLLAGQSIQIADLNNPLISYKVTAGNQAVNLGEIVGRNVKVLAHQVSHGKDAQADAFTQLYQQAGETQVRSRIVASGEVELYAGSVADQLQSTAASQAQVVGERTGLVVNNAEIKVSNATGTAGKVKILGDVVVLGSQSHIDASGFQGGAVNIGGDYQGQGSLKLAQKTTLLAGQDINISGHQDAGTAIVWGDSLSVDGTFTATSVAGKGGFVETSGQQLGVAEDTKVVTVSLQGKDFNGKWLLDPDTLYVTTGAIAGDGSATGTPATNKTIYGNSSTAGSYYVLNTTVQKALETGDVDLVAKTTVFFGGVAITAAKNTLTASAKNVLLKNSTLNVYNLTLRGPYGNAGKGVVIVEGSTVNANRLDIILENNDGQVYIQKGAKVTVGDLGLTAQNLSINASTLKINNDWAHNNQNSNFYVRNGAVFEGARTLELKLLTLDINNSEVKSTGKLSLYTGSNMCVSENAKITGTTDVDLTAYQNLKTSDATITSGGYLIVQAGSTDSETSRFTATKKVSLTKLGADDKDLRLVNTQVSSGTEAVVQAQNIFIRDGSSVKGATSTLVVAEKTATFSNKATFGTETGTTSITANQLLARNVEIHGTDVTVETKGVYDATVAADKQLDEITNSKIVATNTITVTEKAPSIFLFRDNELTADQKIAVTSGSQVVYANDTDAYSKSGAVSFTGTDSTVAGVNLNLTAGGNVDFSAGSVLFQGAKFKGENVKLSTLQAPSSSKAPTLSAKDSTICATKNAEVISAGTLSWQKSDKATKRAQITAGEQALFKSTSTSDEYQFLLVGVDVNAKTIKLDDAGADGKYQTTVWDSQLKASQDVSISSKRDVRVIQSKVEGTTSADVTAGGDLVVDYSSQIKARKGKLKSTSAFLVSNASNIEIDALRVETEQAFTINATSNLTSKSVDIVAKSVVTTGGQVCATDGHLEINATNGDILLTQTYLGQNALGVDQGVKLVAGQGKVELREVNVTSSGAFSAVGNNEVNITNSKVQAIAGSNVQSTAADVNIYDTNLTAYNSKGFTDKDVTITGKNIQVGNSNISGLGVVFTTAADSTLTVHKATLKAAEHNVSFAGTRDINITGTVAESANAIHFRGAQVKVEGGKFEAHNGEISVGDLTTDTVVMNGSNLITSDAAGVLAPQTKNEIGFHGKKGVTVTNTSITSELDLNLSAPEGKVELYKTTAQIERSLNITANSVVLANSSLSSKAVSGVTATTGDIKLNNMSLTQTGTGKLTIEATQGGVTAHNATLQAPNLAVTANQGKLDLSESNLQATNDKLELTAKNVVTTDSSLKSEGATSVTATEKAQLVNTTANSNGTLDVAGATGVEISKGSKLTAKQQVTVSSTAGNVVVESSNLTSVDAGVSVKADAGTVTLNNSKVAAGTEIKLNAKQDLNLGNGTMLTATKAVELTTDANLQAVGSNITSTQAEVTLKAKGTTTLTNTNISGKGVAITGDQGVSISKGFVNSKANLTVTATNNGLVLADGNLSSAGKVEYVVKNGDVTINNSNTSSSTTLNVTASTNVNLGNGTQLTGKQEVILNVGGNLQAVGSNLTSSNADVILKAQGTTTLSNTNISGKGVAITGDQGVSITKGFVNSKANLTVTATNNGLVLADGNLTAAGKVEYVAQAGSVTINNSNTSAGTTLNVSAATDITLGNGTQLTGKQDVSLSAGANLKAEGSNITSVAGNATLTATNAVTLNNTNVSGYKTITVTAGDAINLGNGTQLTGGVDVTLDSKGSITAQGSNITAVKGNATLHAQQHITLNNTNVSGGKNVVVTADQDLNLGNGTQITAQDNVELNAGVNLKSEGSNITAVKGNATLTAKDNITLNNTNVSGGKHVVVDAGKDVSLGNGTQITGQENVDINAGSNITAEGTNITAVKGYANLTAKENITLNNTNVSAGKDVNVNATADVNLGNGTQITGQGDVNINAGHDINSEGVNITAVQGNATLTATNNITLNNTNVSGGKNVVVDAGKEVILGNGTQITGQENVDINAGGNITSEGANITAVKGYANLTAKENITLNNTNVSAGKDVNVNATVDVNLGNGTQITGQGDVNINAGHDIDSEGVNITAVKGNATLTATNNITLNNTNVSSGKNVVIDAGKDVNLGNGTQITGQDNVDINAGGNITSEGANITAVKGYANLTAKENITLNNTNVSAGKDVNIDAGKDVNLGNGTQITGQDNVNINAGGNITSEGANITALEGYANLTAKENITLNNSNISAGKDVNIDAGKDVNLGNGTQITGQDNVNINAGGNITSEGANITAVEGYANLTAKENITLNNSNISAGKDVNIDAGKDVNLGNGTQITGQDNVNINAGGNITSEGTNITAVKGDVNLTAQSNITLNNSNVAAGNRVNIDAGDNVYLGNGTQITGKEDVNINAGGNVTSVGTNITSQNGYVNITAKENVTITNTNISAGKDLDILAGNKVEITNSTLKGDNAFITGDTIISQDSRYDLNHNLTFNGNNITLIHNDGSGEWLFINTPNRSSVIEIDNSWNFQRKRFDLDSLFRRDLLEQDDYSDTGAVAETAAIRDVGRDAGTRLTLTVGPTSDTTIYTYVDRDTNEVHTTVIENKEGEEQRPTPSMVTLSSKNSEGEGTTTYAISGKDVTSTSRQLSNTQFMQRILSTCSFEASAIIKRYRIAADDFALLSLNDIRRKYGMSMAESKFLEQTCNNGNLEWMNKPHRKLR